MIKSNNQSSIEEIDKLKDRIFHKSGNQDDEFGRMCEVIYYLGGYQNFLEAPISLILEFGKFANWREKRFWDNMQKLFGKRGRKQ